MPHSAVAAFASTVTRTCGAVVLIVTNAGRDSNAPIALVSMGDNVLVASVPFGSAARIQEIFIAKLELLNGTLAPHFYEL